MKMTMMPSPPNQCVMLRQKSRLRGISESEVMTVAPVPVKPDRLSKNPSRKPRQPPSTYGSIPSPAPMHQPSPVIVIARTSRRACVTSTPQSAMASPSVRPNARSASPSPQQSASAHGRTSTPAAATASVPESSTTTVRKKSASSRPTTLSGTGSPSSRTQTTMCGCSVRRSSSAVMRPSTSSRTVLSPPAGEPRHAPVNASRNKRYRSKSGHPATAVDENPTVVKNDTA